MSTIKDKVRICQSNIGDFNVELIFGQPFFKRYEEFMRLFRKYYTDGANPEVLFAQPVENTAKGTIDWYTPRPAELPTSLDELRDTMPEDYTRYKAIQQNELARLDKLRQDVQNPQEKLYFDCVAKYLRQDYAEKLVYCFDGKITFTVWGMGMRKGRNIDMVITDDNKDHRIHTVRFRIEGEGTFNGQQQLFRKHGHALQGARDIPEVQPAEGFIFKEWRPTAPQGRTVDDDMEFVAVCVHDENYTPAPDPVVEPPVDDDQPTIKPQEMPSVPDPELHQVLFDAGEHGTLRGLSMLNVEHGTSISPDQVPTVEAKEGYIFKGWDSPVDDTIWEDKVFKAVYEEAPVVLPWYKRWWLWLTGEGCLKRLLWFLLMLLLILLAIFLLRNCDGCSGRRHLIGDDDEVIPIDTIVNDDGDEVEDNRNQRIERGDDGGVINDDGDLPISDADDMPVVAPVRGDDGNLPPIQENPGMPDVVANRLNIYFESDDADLNQFARDFKQAYPDDSYTIVGFDDVVKMVQIQIPEAQRDRVREELQSKIPRQKFFVVDEAIFEIRGRAASGGGDPGWHLRAVNAQQAWQITQGDSSVVVGVVDDGIDAQHDMFRGRIVKPYNVFRQDNHLSSGEGHGTHVAALAAGSNSREFLSKGAAGMAPRCKIMPVQVFDNGQCTFSSLTSGVLYCIHQGADVVNISVGPSFPMLAQLPLPDQEQIARTHFQNEAKVWQKVITLAKRKKTILVFAAGNDNILAAVLPEIRFTTTSINVAAVSRSFTATDFTNYSKGCNISAPGKDIFSAFPVNSFRSMDGTSMAAPMVTGIVALMKSIKRDITVEQALAAMQNTGRNVGDAIPAMVLADKALQAVKSGNIGQPNPDTGIGASEPTNPSNPSTPSNPSNPSTPGQAPVAGTPGQGGSNGDDYADIRRQIEEYKRRIRELEGMLPENQ